jgi:endogenous inhibitor of DNA gyrase (YacG/DUF329 family)
VADDPQPPLCVFCRRAPADARFRPFCSERCQRLDLARWADGAYRVPGEAAPDHDDADSHDDIKPDR